MWKNADIVKYIIYKFFIELKLSGIKKAINRFLMKMGIKKTMIVPKNVNVYVKERNNSIHLVHSHMVSVVLPFKDKPELLERCINSILSSTYKKFEILAVNNNSVEEKTFEEIENLKKLDSRIKFIDYNTPYNFSKINNYAAENFANGEFIVFMNNDVELITRNWIEWFLQYMSLGKIGTIGAKLYYPNNTIQHAGIVILDKHGFSEHIGRYEKRSSKNKLYNQPRYVMANTAALMMIRKKVFEEIGGFDEKLAIDYNDVDLSLKCLERGYKNIWLPFVEAYHYESASRGNNWSVEKLKRFEKERRYLLGKHYSLIKNGDIYYSVIL